MTIQVAVDWEVKLQITPKRALRPSCFLLLLFFINSFLLLACPLTHFKFYNLICYSDMSVNQDQSALGENAKPGEFVLQTLFLELCTITERKIEQVLAEPLVS